MPKINFDDRNILRIYDNKLNRYLKENDIETKLPNNLTVEFCVGVEGKQLIFKNDVVAFSKNGKRKIIGNIHEIQRENK